MTVPKLQQIVRFKDNNALGTQPERYMVVVVDAKSVLRSWKKSLFSFEWLKADGQIKPFDELSQTEQDRRKSVEKLIASGDALERPILGIGIMDNVEIGSGRAEFLTLAALGWQEIEVHIPKSCEDDFKALRA